MSKKNKNIKKILIIVAAVLVIILISEVAMIMKDKGKSSSDQEENPGIVTEEQGTNQEELEVVEEVPVKTEAGSIQKEDASYEKWLAAEVVIGISLQYSDYEFSGIYLASETSINDSVESKGVYVVFHSGAGEIAVHSQPLDAERTVSGTRDLYTEELGFATFDEVAVNSIHTEACEKIEMSELSELISQSVLVSIYEH